ncbi:DUF4179 domain-containing protein [Neobacillus mesonae]|uniref:DUF4179 domain-containing protein n=1 Tax=Neobacillus mesonae TaxID=1193713 RepID=UPI00083392BE|nr:DUF4179 domain-containing protein [Neobacillus mesonae]
MKDIYELLNDIDIDENEFKEIEVSELEKAKVKRTLKKSINRKKKTKGWKMTVAAASIIAGLSVTTLGLTFPAYAKNIPFIDDIFRFFDQDTNTSQDKSSGLFSNYKEFSSEINMTQESNGVKIIVNDAVFDGKTVTITYSIESEKELGNANISLPKIEGMAGTAGTGQTTKIDQNKYVGILTASNIDDHKMNVANIKWNIDKITTPENQTEIKGDWKFAFSLRTTDSKVQLADGSAEKNGVKVRINKVSFTPMSFIIYYDQEVSIPIKNKWDMAYVELEIKDDLGNSYTGASNGGSGIDGINKMSWSKTFGKLDPNAKKLIITPHIYLNNYNSNNYASATITETGEKKVSIPTSSDTRKEDFVLEDIVVELEK